MGKAPGPDRFTTLYYKTFAPNLAPSLTKCFRAMQGGGPIDMDSNRAFITLIPKPHKDHSEVANDRPISLINTNLKVFTKILANRLSTFLSLLAPPFPGPGQVRVRS